MGIIRISGRPFPTDHGSECAPGMVLGARGNLWSGIRLVTPNFLTFIQSETYQTIPLDPLMLALFIGQPRRSHRPMACGRAFRDALARAPARCCGSTSPSCRLSLEKQGYDVRPRDGLARHKTGRLHRRMARQKRRGHRPAFNACPAQIAALGASLCGAAGSGRRGPVAPVIFLY